MYAFSKNELMQHFSFASRTFYPEVYLWDLLMLSCEYRCAVMHHPHPETPAGVKGLLSTRLGVLSAESPSYQLLPETDRAEESVSPVVLAPLQGGRHPVAALQWWTEGQPSCSRSRNLWWAILSLINILFLFTCLFYYFFIVILL